MECEKCVYDRGITVYTRKKGFYMEPKGVLPKTKKASSKGSPMGTAEEPIKVLDSTFFLRV